MNSANQVNGEHRSGSNLCLPAEVLKKGTTVTANTAITRVRTVPTPLALVLKLVNLVLPSMSLVLFKVPLLHQILECVNLCTSLLRVLCLGLPLLFVSLDTIPAGFLRQMLWGLLFWYWRARCWAGTSCSSQGLHN